MLKDKKPYRILVIEDNPGDFLIVEEFLIEQMFSPVITNAQNFRKASEILSASPPRFEVILLDITLPDKSGQDLINEVLRLASLTPVIVLTGYSDIDFSIKSIAQGVMDYLIKDDLNATTLYKSIIYAIERKRSISQLKESEKRYGDLFLLSPQPMWVFDPANYRFVHVNKATIELYGYSEDEFQRMTLMDIKLPEDISETKDHLKNRQTGDGIFKRTIMHYKKSGEIIEVEIYSTPIIIDGKDFITVIAIDVTEKNLYEQRLMKSIIKTQEDERYEIGGELHDNVCQLLATSKIALGMLKPSLPDSSTPAYNRCSEYIMMASDEIRNLSHRLAPAFFNNSTLEEAFSRLFFDFNIDSKFQIALTVDTSVAEYPLQLDIQLNLYRILQEQLRNILKYAKATTIDVEIIIYNKRLVMSITDNGIGFNMNSAKSGIGFANMKRRTELFNGKFEISSSPGNGCSILISIPL
jgi:PAS domain S-box-containing protein